MQIKITAIAGQGAYSLIGLPSGGTIADGATETFTLQHGSDWDTVRLHLAADAAAGKITYDVQPDADGRIGSRSFRVQHSDLTAAAVTETVPDALGALPAGAVLTGYRKTITTEFAGGAVTACTVDIGFDGAGLGDVLDDGQNIFTGAGTGETYGAGGNALPLVRRSIGTETIQVKVDAVGANVVALTAGDMTIEVFYFVQ